MRKEKYIKSSKRKGITYFQVYFTYNHGQDHYSKNFCSADYPTEAQCLNAACKDRDKARADLIDGKLAHKSAATVQECFDEYEAMFVNRKGTHTVHCTYYNNYIKKEFGETPVQKITAKTIMGNLNSLVYELSANGISKVHAVWASIMKQARLNRYILVNPMEEVIKPKSQKIEVKRNQISSAEDVQKVIDYLMHTYSNPQQQYDHHIVALMIKLMRAIGCRPAEACAFQRGVSYDFSEHMIHIVQQYGTDENEQAIVRTKAQSTRDIPMTDETEDILREAEEMSDNEFIFQRYSGELYDSHHMIMTIRYALKGTGVKDFHPYCLRHGLISTAIKETGDIRAVMEIAGHTGATAAVSLDYARSNEADKKKILNLVENSLKRS